MDLTQLRYFRAVARQGSITGGAKSLAAGQSTVSEAIRALEDELGSKLFLRTRSGVVCTEAGALLLDRADAVLVSVEQMALELRDLERGDVGRFVLGCHDSLGSYFLPGFLKPFLEENPRIDVDLWNRSSAEVRQAVLDREVHFGLVVNTAPHPDLVITRLFEDSICLFGNSCTSLDEARELVARSTLVYPNRQPFVELLHRCIGAGLQPARVLACGDLGLAKSLALGGIGPALLPRRVALDGAGGSKLVLINSEIPRFDDVIHLVSRSDLPRTRAARRVREALVAYGRSLPR